MIPLGVFRNCEPEQVPREYAVWLIRECSGMISPELLTRLKNHVGNFKTEAKDPYPGGTREQKIVAQECDKVIDRLTKAIDKGAEKEAYAQREIVETLKERLLAMFKKKAEKNG